MTDRLINVEALARHLRSEKVPDSDIVRPHTPLLFSPFAMPYAFEHDATCPLWDSYLAGVQPDPADREVLQMLAGLALVPDTNYNVFFMLYGEAGTGKSVFLYVLTELVGRANVCCLPLSKFADRFSTWMLTAYLLNVVGDMPTEVENGPSLHSEEGVLKDATDGGLMPVEHKGVDPTQATAIARCVFATNSMPRFTDLSAALWDRLRIIPFDVRFRGTGQEIPNLRYTIAETELPGVFLWAVRGLAKLRGLVRFPEHSGGLAAKQRHREACDPERTYLEETYERTSGNRYVDASKAYTEFCEWVHSLGMNKRGEARFKESVRRVFGVEQSRNRMDGNERKRVYWGLQRRGGIADEREF